MSADRPASAGTGTCSAISVAASPRYPLVRVRDQYRTRHHVSAAGGGGTGRASAGGRWRRVGSTTRIEWTVVHPIANLDGSFGPWSQAVRQVELVSQTARERRSRFAERDRPGGAAVPTRGPHPDRPHLGTIDFDHALHRSPYGDSDSMAREFERRSPPAHLASTTRPTPCAPGASQSASLETRLCRRRRRMNS